MPESWVVNASPIISLARVDRADFLLNIPDECVIPSAVVSEIMAGPEADPARVFLQNHRITVVEVALSDEILAWDLGHGETSVLSFALTQPAHIAIVDDAAARKCAASFSIPVKGTLAVVILAKRKKLIPSASDVLRSLRTAGFFLNDAVIKKVLSETVGEDWA